MSEDLHWSDALDDVDWEELSAVYLAAPLGIKSGAHLRGVFTASRFRCFVRQGGRLVGAGRVLSDGADCAYICDIALLPTHQGSGLGSPIVEHLVALSRGHRKIILYAVPGREGFYARFGFRRMKTAMAIFADQEDAVARGYVEEG